MAEDSGYCYLIFHYFFVLEDDRKSDDSDEDENEDMTYSTQLPTGKNNNQSGLNISN